MLIQRILWYVNHFSCFSTYRQSYQTDYGQTTVYNPASGTYYQTAGGAQVYSKTCLKWPLKRRPKMVFKANYRLMHVKSIAGSILQYFRPSLSYHLSLISLFCLFLSGRLRQVLLYFSTAYIHNSNLLAFKIICHVIR